MRRRRVGTGRIKRTACAVELEFVVFTQGALQYQRIGPEARVMRHQAARLGRAGQHAGIRRNRRAGLRI